MKKKIEQSQMYYLDGEQFLWEDIKRHARSDQDIPHSEAKDLINWLVTVDLSAHKRKPADKSFFPNYRFFCRKYLPYPLYALGKNLLTKLHS